MKKQHPANPLQRLYARLGFGKSTSFPLRFPDARSWCSERITDPWFRDHFEYASSVVEQWLRAETSMDGMTLLDFGCGDGITDLALALKCQPGKVIGVDITAAFTQLAKTARSQIGLKKLPGNLAFQKIDEGHRLAGSLEANAIISWSAFEHIDRRFIDEIVADLFDLLPSGGLFFLQIEPLFYSPLGSHLGRFIKEPWAHLLWDERKLKQAVRDCVDDIPENEKELNFFTRTLDEYKSFIYGGFLKLNKLTANEINSILCAHGFKIIREERSRVAMPAPDILLPKFQEEDLLTNEIRLLLRKP